MRRADVWQLFAAIYALVIGRSARMAQSFRLPLVRAKSGHNELEEVRRRCLLIILSALSLSAASCNAKSVLGEQLPTYRYRVTVEVNTPKGIRSGSSVIQVETFQAGQVALPSAYAIRRTVTGEAVPVDLGHGRLVFALLRHGYDQTWPDDIMRQFINPVVGTSLKQYRSEEIHRILGLKGIKTIPKRVDPLYRGNHLPDFVYFDDILQLTSIRHVPTDNFASVLGKGYSLRCVTVQIVTNPVSHRIVSILPWLMNPAIFTGYNQHSNTDYHIAFLSHGDFVLEH